MAERKGFAERLRTIREEAGISQYRLAKLSGISKQSLSRLELGETQPSWETVQRLATALGVDCRQFEDPSIALPERAASRGRGRPPKASPSTVPTSKRKRK